ncbi:hypothetical protein HOA92_03865 [archaeon]|nr:hypothetical protein [archaeon]MBT6762149.1 hypothetical protein [archaeon]
MAKRLENPEFSLSSFKYSSGSGAGIWTDSSDTWYEQHGILEDNEISLLSALTLKHYMINKTKDSD